MIEKLVQKHGKQVIKELIDIIVISKSFNGTDVRPMLIKYKVIKSTTKSTNPIFTHYQCMGRLPNGVWGKLDDYENSLSIVNGRNQSILYLHFKDSELPHILELLNNN